MLKIPYQFLMSGRRHIDRQALTLADEWTAIGGKVHQGLLRDLPRGLVDSLQVIRDGGDILDRAYMECRGSISARWYG